MIYKAATTLVLTLVLQAVACTQQLQSGWQLDVQKSKVLWNTGKKMGGHSGYFRFHSGSLQFSASCEPVSGIFRMDMNSIRSTDNPNEAGRQKTDANLRKSEFFDSDQHPTATMVVKKITRISPSLDYTVAGDLTIKGISNPIEFTARIDTKNNTSHITANVDISRQLWNIDSKPQAASVDFLLGIKEKFVQDIHVSLDITMNK
jgi:polyisoprenoid-binding protein YceI